MAHLEFAISLSPQIFNQSCSRSCPRVIGPAICVVMRCSYIFSRNVVGYGCHERQFPLQESLSFFSEVSRELVNTRHDEQPAIPVCRDGSFLHSNTLISDSMQ